MRRVLLVACAVVVACALGGVAVPAAAQEPPPSWTLTVTPDTDLLESSVVTLHGTGFDPFGDVYFCQAVLEAAYPEIPGDDCGGPIANVRPNEAGEFSASYTVTRFVKPRATGVEVDCAQPETPCAMAATSYVGGYPRIEVSLAFRPGPRSVVTATPTTGLVDGDIVDVVGTGLPPSASVSICQAPASSATSCDNPVTGETDTTGGFSASTTVRRFVALTPEKSSDCAAPTSSCVLRVAVDGGTVAQLPLAFAPQSHPIFGTVTDVDGAPIAGVEVLAFRPQDTWVASLYTVTNAEGRYAFTEVGPGVEYRVLFHGPTGTSLSSEWFDDARTRQAATPVVVGDGEFVELNAQLDEIGSLSGVVTDASGDPVSGVVVRAYRPEDGLLPGYTATTAADGGYEIPAVGPGTLRVGFAPPSGSGLAREWFDDAATRSQATDVTVDAGQTVSGIDAQLAAAP